MIVWVGRQDLLHHGDHRVGWRFHRNAEPGERGRRIERDRGAPRDERVGILAVTRRVEALGLTWQLLHCRLDVLRDLLGGGTGFRRFCRRERLRGGDIARQHDPEVEPDARRRLGRCAIEIRVTTETLGELFGLSRRDWRAGSEARRFQRRIDVILGEDPELLGVRVVVEAISDFVGRLTTQDLVGADEGRNDQELEGIGPRHALRGLRTKGQGPRQLGGGKNGTRPRKPHGRARTARTTGH